MAKFIKDEKLFSRFDILEPVTEFGFLGKPEKGRYFGVEIEVEYSKRVKGMANAGGLFEYYDYVSELVSEYSDSHSIGHYDIFNYEEVKSSLVVKNLSQLEEDYSFLEKCIGSFAILRSDGSLNNGVEIVTAPASYEIQLRQWQNYFNNTKHLKFVPRKTCGMHVHVSRKSLTKETVNNMRDFIKAAENRKFIVQNGCRNEHDYCTYEYSGSGASHYHAINIQNNSTVEFRLFDAPKDYSEFKRNLTFVKNVVEYCESKNYDPSYESFKLHISGGNNIRKAKGKVRALSRY